MDKRNQIIEIATRLFSEQGFENTPLSKISGEAKVSKGLISHHFKTKEGLLRAIFEQTTQTIKEINQHEERELTAKDQLLASLESFFNQIEEDKMLFQLNLHMMMQPNTREILKDLIKERASFILDSVKNIFDKIDAKNSLALSYVLIAELDGIAVNYLVSFSDYPLQLLKKQLLKKYQSF